VITERIISKLDQTLATPERYWNLDTTISERSAGMLVKEQLQIIRACQDSREMKWA
jgi:hypothetical protein